MGFRVGVCRWPGGEGLVLIVVHDAGLATVYPIDIYKDHMKYDRVHATP